MINTMAGPSSHKYLKYLVHKPLKQLAATNAQPLN